MTQDAAVPASIVTDPPGVTWTNLEPGDSFSTSVVVTNTFPFPVELRSVVTREGFLFSGSHPLVVTFDIVGGQAGACPLRADAIPANSHARVRIDVAFPAAAGNEYQNQSGSAGLFFSATEITSAQCSGAAAAEPPAGGGGGGGSLADTGFDLAVPLLVALALAMFGSAVRASARRRRAPRGSS